MLDVGVIPIAEVDTDPLLELLSITLTMSLGVMYIPFIYKHLFIIFDKWSG